MPGRMERAYEEFRSRTTPLQIELYKQHGLNIGNVASSLEAYTAAGTREHKRYVGFLKGRGILARFNWALGSHSFKAEAARQSSAAFRGALRKPSFSLPGAGRSGRVLEGKAVWEAVRTTQAAAAAQFDPLMSMMGRTSADPAFLYSALQSVVGKQAGTPIFKETPVAGMLGMRIGGKEVLLPTPYGPYMAMPTKEGGVMLMATGTKDNLEVLQHVADNLRERTDLEDASVRQIRRAVMAAASPLRGSEEEAAVMFRAGGTALDFLKINRGTIREIQNEIAEANARGEYFDLEAEASRVMRMQSTEWAPGKGYHPMYTKVDYLRRGGAARIADPTRLFGFMASGGKPLHQDIVFASILKQDTSRFEKAAFGRTVPRLRTAEAVTLEKTWGNTTQQTAAARIGMLSPSHPLWERLAGTTKAGTEQVIISSELADRLRFMDRSGGPVRHVGLGTPIKLGGHSLIIGGVMESSAMGNQHLLMAVSDMTKHEDRLQQLLVGDALFRAQMEDKLRTGKPLTVEGVGTFSLTGAKIHGTPQQIVFTPSKSLSAHGMGTVAKKVARAVGVDLPKTQGGMISIVGEFGIRGDMMVDAPSGVKASVLDFMAMATSGPASRVVARKMLRRARVLRGHESQGFFAFFSAFTNKALPPSLFTTKTWRGENRKPVLGYKRFKPGEIAADLPSKLRGIRTLKDITELLASESLPENEIVLQLSKAIKLPTPVSRSFVEGAPDAFSEVSEIALPPIRRLQNLIRELSRGGKHLDDAARLALEETRAFIPKYLHGVSRVIQAAQEYELDPVKGLAALESALYKGGTETMPWGEEKYEGLLSLLTKHTGGKKLISRVLQPKIGKARYTQIVHGTGRDLGGLPEVDIGEISISKKMAKKLGYSKAEIRAAMSGEFVPIGQQYWPSLVPEAQAVKKLKVHSMSWWNLSNLGRRAWSLVSTNVYDRLAAFRDVDYDPTKIFKFSGIRTDELKALWEEHVDQLTQIKGRIDDFWAKAGAVNVKFEGDVFRNLLGLSEEEAAQLLSQKVMAPKHHKYIRNLQAMVEYKARDLEKKYGGTVANASRALGVVYQMAGIKKGKAGDYGQEIVSALKQIGRGGSLEAPVESIAEKLAQFGEQGRLSDVFLGLNPTQYKQTAQYMAEAAVALRDPAMKAAAERMNLLSGREMDEAGLLQMVDALTQRTDTSGHMIADQISGMTAVGRTKRAPGSLEVAQSIAERNALEKSEGALEKNAGGMARRLWANTPGWAKLGLGIAGGLVGLRMAKSALSGDEPDYGPPPGNFATGAPIPPQPLGMQAGMHQQLASAPMPSFSAPTARVISPLQRSPSVTMTATAPQGMNMQGMGEMLAMAASSPAGAPLAGVFSSGISDTSRIDNNIAEDLRLGNRLYT